ncbi:exopolysaccharide biosynthesis protein [Roseibium sp. MB-4]
MAHDTLTTITGVLDSWETEIEDGSADVGSILRAVGSRAAGPLLFLPALVMISPLGAVPGVPLVLSACIILISVQVLSGNGSVAVPRSLANTSIPREKAAKTVDSLRPYAAWLDGILGRRLQLLTGTWATRAVAALCVCHALTVFPAALVPLAAALPGGAIMVLSLGLLTRDGIVTAAGFLFSAAAFAAIWWLAF